MSTLTLVKMARIVAPIAALTSACASAPHSVYYMTDVNGASAIVVSAPAMSGGVRNGSLILVSLVHSPGKHFAVVKVEEYRFALSDAHLLFYSYPKLHDCPGWRVVWQSATRMGLIIPHMPRPLELDMEGGRRAYDGLLAELSNEGKNMPYGPVLDALGHYMPPSSRGDYLAAFRPSCLRGEVHWRS